MADDNKKRRSVLNNLIAGAEMADDDWQRDTRRQFVGVLRSSLAAAVGRLDPAALTAKKPIIERIEGLLKGRDGLLPEWRDAFEAEQMICFVQSGPLVETDIRNRLIDATTRALPGTADRAALFKELMAAQPPAEEAAKQALLFALVCDLQKASQKNSQVRQMRLGAIRFVMVLACVAVVLVAMPFIVYLFHVLFGSNADGWPASFIALVPNYGLFTAASFGMLGALFGRFILLQQSEIAVPIDEAAAYYSRRYIMLRVFIGLVGAIIVYFFLGSELISGQIVPNIHQLTFVPSTGEPFRTFLGLESKITMVPGKQFALLVVWSFLAGFSERLVPNLLNDTAGRIDGSSKKAAEAK